MLQNYTSCPHCQRPMETRDRHGVTIDFCPACRGVWLDRGELDTIIERSGRVLEIPDPSPRETRSRHHPTGLRRDSFSRS
ncbi:MAG: zf-TFIIB domain-containing protein [Tepidisphaerales bacterium]